MEEKLNRLLEAVASAHKVLILPHNDPDPDAIASAVALRHLLVQKSGVPVDIAYRGIIGRAENKALARYLGQPLRRLVRTDLQATATVALVDTQPGAGNNPLPASTLATIVLDHHPWREETAAVPFADVRPDTGSTSTILTEYLQASGIEPDAMLATALFYGIKTDTMGLGRGAGPSDAAAYFYLQPRIDTQALFDIERAQVPATYFQSFAATLQAARIYKNVVTAYIGPVSYPDLAAEMADMLLRLEGGQWIICMGLYKDQITLAVRSRSRRGGAGQLAQAMINGYGTAGGHGLMAGGQVPLNGADPVQIVAQMSRNALQHLNIAPDEPGRPLI
ncbi:MAG TPA: bifunctional oligoribonuclease/PAP phosphatase NrnA [Anaerolineae bacterium]